MMLAMMVASVPVAATGVAAPVPISSSLFVLSHVILLSAAKVLVPLLNCTWPVVPAGTPLPPEPLPPTTRQRLAAPSYCKATELLFAIDRSEPVPVMILFAAADPAFWFDSVKVLADVAALVRYKICPA